MIGFNLWHFILFCTSLSRNRKWYSELRDSKIAFSKQTCETENLRACPCMCIDNASKTIVIAHVCPCEFGEMPRCIVFDSWPQVVHQFPVQVLLFRSPWYDKL